MEHTLGLTIMYAVVLFKKLRVEPFARAMISLPSTSCPRFKGYDVLPSGLKSLWSPVFGFWFLVFSLWSLVSGCWCLVSGVWSLVFGLWSLVFGLWSLVLVCWSFVFRWGGLLVMGAAVFCKLGVLSP